MSSLLERGRKLMPSGSSNMGGLVHPGLYLAAADGSFVIDVEGKRYLDFMGNWTAVLHGHAHPAVTEAMIHEARRALPTTQPSEPEILLAELLCSRVPSFDMIKFHMSGSAAGMLAVKVARAFTGRRKIARFEGTYHGNYDPLEISFNAGAPAWGDPSSPSSLPFHAGTPQSIVDDVVVLPVEDLPNVERLLRQHAGELAAVFIDLMPPRHGLVPASAACVELLRRVTSEIGALLVFDEVITFRQTLAGLQARYSVRPDLTMMGKIIGGGLLPIGAVAGRADVMSAFADKVQIFGTFTANPMTMAAGVAAMGSYTQDVIDKMDALGERARAGLRRAFEATGVPGQVTGVGSQLAYHFHQRPLPSFRNARPASPAEFERQMKMLHHLRHAGILFGLAGGAIMASMTEPEIDGFCHAFEDGLKQLAGTA